MDRPILFSAPMIRSLIDGRKTQTRRVLTPHNAEFGSASREFWKHADFSRAWKDGRSTKGGEYLHVPCHADENDAREPVGVDCRRCDEMGWTTTVHRLWPKTVPGYRLWVREAWRTAVAYDDLAPSQMGGEEPIFYEADGERRTWGHPVTSPKGRLRASMHMPRWASRLTLIVREVRVQRLQEISEEDAIAEGIDDRDPVCGFSELWDEINGPGAWQSNPWVCAISFTVHKANIDAIANAEPSND